MAEQPPPARAEPHQLSAARGYTTRGSQIVDHTGGVHQIKAVAWFGLETSNCTPHGLWAINLDEGLRFIASAGFNTLRVPYSNQCLAAGPDQVSGIDYQRNPDLAGLSPQLILDEFIDRAAAHGLDIILDRHRPDFNSQSALWYTDAYPTTRWISDWQALASRYRDNPTVIGADLHNEPHGQACWGCGDPTRDWAASATQAGNAVLDIAPHWLILIEGVERSAAGGNYWWCGQLTDARSHPIRLNHPAQLVYSPHDYPASIYPQPWFNDPAYPRNLSRLWTQTWGYLHKSGAAPVLLGEFGTRALTRSDTQWLRKLVAYLERNNMSFAYWSFNPNSGDTGGLVGDDWRTAETKKLRLLAPLLK